MTIKSFRGLIATKATTDTIVLHTNTGSTGYRIVKFDIMPSDPFNDDYESIVQLFKVPKTSPVDAAGNVIIDFSDNTLLAAGMWSSRGGAESYPEDKSVIFDNEIFNQDIYVHYDDTKTNNGMNYYIELEQIKLDLNENTVATLKDIRNIASQ